MSKKNWAISGFMAALPVMAPSTLPPRRSRIFLKTILLASLNFRLVIKSDWPLAASSRFFLAASTPITNRVFGQTALLVHLGPQTVIDPVKDAGHGNKPGWFDLNDVIGNGGRAFRKAHGAADTDDGV